MFFPRTELLCGCWLNWHHHLSPPRPPSCALYLPASSRCSRRPAPTPETHSQDRLKSGWGFQQKRGWEGGDNYKGAFIRSAHKTVKLWPTLRSSKYSWDTFSDDRQSHPHHSTVEDSGILLGDELFVVVSRGINTCFLPLGLLLVHSSMRHHGILVQFCSPPLPRTHGSFLYDHLRSGKGLEQGVEWKDAVPEGFIWIARETGLGQVLFLHPYASGCHASLLNAAHILNWNQLKQLASITFFLNKSASHPEHLRVIENRHRATEISIGLFELMVVLSPYKHFIINSLSG